MFPKGDVWQRDKQEEFIRELRSVDPEVTGSPVQLYEYTSGLVRSVEKALLYAVGRVAAVLLLHFRRLSFVLLALLPVAPGLLVDAGGDGVVEPRLQSREPHRRDPGHGHRRHQQCRRAIELSGNEASNFKLTRAAGKAPVWGGCCDQEPTSASASVRGHLSARFLGF